VKEWLEIRKVEISEYQARAYMFISALETAAPNTNHLIFPIFQFVKCRRNNRVRRVAEYLGSGVAGHVYSILISYHITHVHVIPL